MLNRVYKICTNIATMKCAFIVWSRGCHDINCLAHHFSYQSHSSVASLHSAYMHMIMNDASICSISHRIRHRIAHNCTHFGGLQPPWRHKVVALSPVFGCEYQAEIVENGMNYSYSLNKKMGIVWIRTTLIYYFKYENKIASVHGALTLVC